jgi:multiple sugar transport system permease protein
MARELAAVEFVANPIQRAFDKIRNRGALWIVRLVLYGILVDLGFVYFLPMAFMVLTSFKSPLDLENPTVGWLPTSLFVENYTFAWSQLGYGAALERTVAFVLIAVVGQVLSTALVGYGFARYSRIRGVGILFLLAIFTFLVPPQTIVVSTFLNYKILGWLSTYYPLTVPEWFGQGIRGAFFIFIFRQAFGALPWELEEAARVDGATAWNVFWRVMLPLVRPSIAVAFVFSVVWHWNETFAPSNFLQDKYKIWPLSLELQNFTNQALSNSNPLSSGGSAGSTSQFQQSTLLTASSYGAIMAASVLVILPPLIFYILIQRVFVQGVERTGLIE